MQLVFGMALLSVAWLFVFLLIASVWYTARFGVLCRVDRQTYLWMHRSAASYTIIFTVALFIAVVLLRYVIPEHDVSIWLLAIHIPAASVFLVLSVAARVWLNGAKYPKWHRPLMKTDIFMFVVMITTGIALLLGDSAALSPLLLDV